MIYASDSQVLSVWTDLMHAYYGEAAYGSDTAEIYAYRLQRYDPLAHSPLRSAPGELSEDAKAELHLIGVEAAQTMRDIVHLFTQELDCFATIDNLDCDTWQARIGSFDHRCHVKIIHKEETPARR